MDIGVNIQHTAHECMNSINVTERAKQYRNGDHRREDVSLKKEILAQIKESIYCIEDEMTKKAINIAIKQCNESIRSINKIP